MKQDSDWYITGICKIAQRVESQAEYEFTIQATFHQTDGVRSSEWITSVQREADNALDVGHPLQVAEMLRELASKLEKNFGEVETGADDFNEFMRDCSNLTSA